jgi:hypothetical protein
MGCACSWTGGNNFMQILLGKLVGKLSDGRPKRGEKDT